MADDQHVSHSEEQRLADLPRQTAAEEEEETPDEAQEGQIERPTARLGLWLLVAVALVALVCVALAWL